MKKKRMRSSPVNPCRSQLSSVALPPTPTSRGTARQGDAERRRGPRPLVAAPRRLGDTPALAAATATVKTTTMKQEVSDTAIGCRSTPERCSGSETAGRASNPASAPPSAPAAAMIPTSAEASTRIRTRVTPSSASAIARRRCRLFDSRDTVTTSTMTGRQRMRLTAVSAAVSASGRSGDR